MRMQTCVKAGGAIGMIALLAACGSNGGIAGQPRNTAPQTFESEFGSAFATIFDASPTSQPVTPTSSSVPPLTPASQPLSPPSTAAM